MFFDYDKALVRVRYASILLLSALSLSACGTKGALILPGERQSAAPHATSAPTVASPSAKPSDVSTAADSSSSLK
ncbi:MAG: lipoprotein [Pseudomonadota bacterium]